MSVNKFIGIGYLGADSELRYTQSGHAVLNFRIAITEKWKDQNGNAKEHTEWVSCVLWGNRGEALAQYLQKGTRVYVEGGLRTSSFDDKDGNKRYKTEVNVRELELLGGGSRDDSRQQQGQRQQSQQGGYSQGGRQQQQGGGGQRGGQQNGGQQQRQQGQQGGGYQQQGQRQQQPQGRQQGGQQRQQQSQDDWDGGGPLGNDDIPF